MNTSRLLSVIACLAVLAVDGAQAENDVAGQLEQLNNTTPNLRVAAMRQLAVNPGGVLQYLSKDKGDAAIAAIERAISDPEKDVRANAAGLLYQIQLLAGFLAQQGQAPPINLSQRPSLASRVRTAISDHSADVRESATLLATNAVAPSAQFEAALLEQWKREESPKVRLTLVQVLAVHRYTSEPTRLALRDALKDKDFQVREQAASTLATLDLATPKDTGDLRRLVDAMTAEKEGYVRKNMLVTILRYGPVAKPYLTLIDQEIAAIADAPSRQTMLLLSQAVRGADGAGIDTPRGDAATSGDHARDMASTDGADATPNAAIRAPSPTPLSKDTPGDERRINKLWVIPILVAIVAVALLWYRRRFLKRPVSNRHL